MFLVDLMYWDHLEHWIRVGHLKPTRMLYQLQPDIEKLNFTYLDTIRPNATFSQSLAWWHSMTPEKAAHIFKLIDILQ